MWDIVDETAREGLKEESDRGMKKLVRLTALGVFGVGLALGGVAGCAQGSDDYVVAEYEDCDVEDQQNREDDCGYWAYNGLFYVGRMPGQGAIWHYWNWVTPGRTSWAPVGWTAPHGLKAPAASSATKKRYTEYQKTLPKNQKPADSVKNGNQPKSGGNQGVPKNDSGTTTKRTTTGSGTTRTKPKP